MWNVVSSWRNCVLQILKDNSSKGNNINSKWQLVLKACILKCKLMLKAIWKKWSYISKYWFKLKPLHIIFPWFYFFNVTVSWLTSEFSYIKSDIRVTYLSLSCPFMWYCMMNNKNVIYVFIYGRILLVNGDFTKVRIIHKLLKFNLSIFNF